MCCLFNVQIGLLVKKCIDVVCGLVSSGMLLKCVLVLVLGIIWVLLWCVVFRYSGCSVWEECGLCVLLLNQYVLLVVSISDIIGMCSEWVVSCVIVLKFGMVKLFVVLRVLSIVLVMFFGELFVLFVMFVVLYCMFDVCLELLFQGQV